MSNTSNKKVAFIGLGVMGYPMAGHLARAGDPAVLMLVGELELERNQPEAALAAFRDVIAARPGVQPAINASVRILMSTGRRDEAEALAAELSGAPRNALYAQALALKQSAAG